MTQKRDLSEILTGVNGLLVVISGLAGLAATWFGAIQTLLGNVGISPTTARILAALALAVGTLLLVAYSRLRGRSRLLRPDALIIETGNPAHLQGRSDELRRLQDVCRRQRLVFLIGESGAGKTALLSAGLMKNPPHGFYPIYIDSWGDDWERGPFRALRSAVNDSLTTEQKTTLGVPAVLGDSDLQKVLEGSNTKLGLMPLVVMDQFDDYQTQHRERFLRENLWVSASEIIKTNAFWRLAADLLKNESIHLLVATRSDAAPGLDAIRLVPEPDRFNLDRLHVSHVEAILRILSTAATTDQEVVSNPENGWVQLRERLAVELATNDVVLPAQMRMAFVSLRALSPLTVGRFEGVGRLEGLEAAYVRDRIAQAARASSLSDDHIRAMLLALLDRDRKKTIVRALPVLKAAAIDVKQASSVTDGQIGNALHDLIQKGVIRKRIDPETGDTAYSLVHDYLSRGVVGAHRRANLWTERLREGEHQLALAKGSSVSSWRALLPGTTSVRFAVDRLRGRFKYGQFADYARVSMLRTIPAIVLAVIGSVTWYIVQSNTTARILSDRMFDSIFADNNDGLWTLASAPENVKSRVLEKMLESELNARSFSSRPEPIVAALWGLDLALAVRTYDAVAVPKLRLDPVQPERVVAITRLLQRLPPASLSRTRVEGAVAAIERLDARPWATAVLLVERAIDQASTQLSDVRKRLQQQALAMVKSTADDQRGVLIAALIELCSVRDRCEWEPLATAFTEAKSESDRRMYAALLLGHMRYASMAQIARLGSSFRNAVQGLPSQLVSRVPGAGTVLRNQNQTPMTPNVCAQSPEDRMTIDAMFQNHCTLDDATWANIAARFGVIQGEEPAMTWNEMPASRRDWARTVIKLLVSWPARRQAWQVDTATIQSQPDAAAIQSCLAQARQLPSSEVAPAFTILLVVGRLSSQETSMDLTPLDPVVMHLLSRMDPMQALRDVAAQVAKTDDSDAGVFLGKVGALAANRSSSAQSLGLLINAIRLTGDSSQIDSYSMPLVATAARVDQPEELMRRLFKLAVSEEDPDRMNAWTAAMVEIAPRLSAPAWSKTLVTEWLRSPYQPELIRPLKPLLPSLSVKEKQETFKLLVSGGKKLAVYSGELDAIFRELAAEVPTELVLETIQLASEATEEVTLQIAASLVTALGRSIPPQLASQLFTRLLPISQRSDRFTQSNTLRSRSVSDAIERLAGELPASDVPQALGACLKETLVQGLAKVVQILVKRLTLEQKTLVAAEVLRRLSQATATSPLVPYLQALDDMQVLSAAQAAELLKWPRVAADDRGRGFLLNRFKATSVWDVSDSIVKGAVPGVRISDPPKRPPASASTSG